MNLTLEQENFLLERQPYCRWEKDKRDCKSRGTNHLNDTVNIFINF